MSFLSGTDKRNRSAIIKVFDGTKVRFIKRPIERLYPIEVRSSVPICDEEVEATKRATIDSFTGANEDTRERSTRNVGDKGHPTEVIPRINVGEKSKQ